MTMIASVRFGREKPVIVPAIPYPGDKDKMDLTATVDYAERQRTVERTGADPVDYAEVAITVKRHVPKDHNEAIEGSVSPEPAPEAGVEIKNDEDE
jgi:dihydroneopterin aldolase